MTSALDGRADERKGGCVIVTVTKWEGVQKSEIFADVTCMAP